MNWIKRILKAIGFRIEESHHGEDWKKADEFLLREMSINGASDEAIAKKLGRTKRAIQQKRYTETK